jgi:hypothetical protein
MKLGPTQDCDESSSGDVPPRRILALAELDALAAAPYGLTLVAWAPAAPRAADVKLLTQTLPPSSTLVLTGDNAALPAWRMLTRGDLRALRDGCGLRSIAVEAEPRIAIAGAMQQLSATEELVVVQPPDVPRWQIEFCIRCGEEHRGDLHSCDE